MREIKLTQGYVALVNDEDYDRLVQYNWNAQERMYTVYAYRNCRDSGSSRAMHTDIMGKRPGFDIDHKDRNGLNNCRSNLRFATKSQNGG